MILAEGSVGSYTNVMRIIMSDRAYVTIDLNQLVLNVVEIEKHIGTNTKILCVIKTNAYGHGAVAVAKAIENLNVVEGFAVATAKEALELREANINKRILLLGYSFEEDYEDLIRNHVTICVFQEEVAKNLSKVATKLDMKCNLHLKIDTGMNRIGITPDEDGLALARKIQALSNVTIEGMFTHFAYADEEKQDKTVLQNRGFLDFVKKAEQVLEIPHLLKHSANSAGILGDMGTEYDFVRAGIILYGIYPSIHVNVPTEIRPILSFRSTIVFLKTVPMGTPISYGGTYITNNVTKVATIPVGYGDGYPRDLSNKGYVLVRGVKAPIIGRICMDQFMVDVTHIPDVTEGDVVTLIGIDGEEHISVEELSSMSSHFYYEIPCCLTNRVERKYISHINHR